MTGHIIRQPYRIVDSRGRPGWATLHWQSSDPLAVRLELTNDDGTPVHWYLSRDHLADGLTGNTPAVEGDVQITQRFNAISITLQGRYSILIRRDSLRDYLRATFRHVKRGEEQIEPAVDEALTRLFDGTTEQ